MEHPKQEDHDSERVQGGEPLDSVREMETARNFFRDLGVPLDAEGLLSEELTAEQVQKMAEWYTKTSERGIQMPTESIFYKKVFAAVSLWRQSDKEGEIAYLLGKGTGVEIALRGNVRGREKRPQLFPYRSHSDFELYAVKYAADTSDANLGGVDVYSPAFLAVLGSQEYFLPTKTKGLSDLPPDLLYQTHETVDLGGVDILVPELELMYLDKLTAREGTPRAEGYDHELLAKQYVLDIEKVLRYLDLFVLPRKRSKIEELYSLEKVSVQVAGIKEYMKMYEREHELLGKTEPADWADALNILFDNQRHTEMSNISSLYWVPLVDTDFTSDRQLADEVKLTMKIKEQILQGREAGFRGLEKIRENQRAFLESVA